MVTTNDKLEITLSDKEQTAIEMRFEGVSHMKIAEKVEMNYGSVRNWFKVGGRLYEAYKAYAKEEAEMRHLAALDMFKAHLGHAVGTLVDVMSKSKFDPARVTAARAIIDRQLGEPLKLVVVNNDRVLDYLEAIKKNDEIKTISADVAPRENTGVETS